MEVNGEWIREPRRMRLVPALALLLVLIYLAVTLFRLLVPTTEPGMRIGWAWQWGDDSSSSGAYTSGRFNDPPVWFYLSNLDRDPEDWAVSTQWRSSSDVRLHIELDAATRSGPTNVLTSPATTRREVRMKITRLAHAGPQPNATLDAAFQREFGGTTFAHHHPAFQEHLMPKIEAAIGEVAVEAISGPVMGLPHVLASIHGGSLPERPRVLIGESEGRDIRVVYRTESNRWAEIASGIPLALGTWLVVSVCVVGLVTVSRERKARRWVAMKCPKCGYERQRDRDECPECGLVYERPSYVMWDPTEDVAEPSKAERNAR